MKRGVRLGADVPYCLMRGTALSEGIGEILTPLDPVPQCQVLIAKPSVSVSTKFVYENLYVNQLPKTAHPDIDRLMRAIEDRDLKGLAENMGNILETVTIPAHPVIQDIKDKMMAMGAVGAMMSGSGPTVFGLFRSPARAEEAYEEMRYGSAASMARQVYLTRFYNRNKDAT